MNLKKLIIPHSSLILVITLWTTTTFAEPKAMICPPLPEFDFDTQCLVDDFFEEAGPDHIRDINKRFDQKLELIFRDNIAHPTYSTKRITQDFRAYEQCFESLCNRIIESPEIGGCGGGTANRIPTNQLRWCHLKKSQFSRLQKAKMEYYLTQNTSRKYRSLYEEKVGRIGYRFHTYIHSTHMQHTLNYLTVAKSMIHWLIKFPVR